MQSVAKVLDHLRSRNEIPPCRPLQIPLLHPDRALAGSRLFLGIGLAHLHMTDELHQIQQGMAQAGFLLVGNGLAYPEPDVRVIRRQHPSGIWVIQDRREWDPNSHIAYDRTSAFRHIEEIRDDPAICRVTILKDAHSNVHQMRAWHEEMGIHLWIVYYHPQLVSALSGFVRPNHLVRTYHSLDPNAVPPIDYRAKSGCLISGAVSMAYPLRHRLIRDVAQLPQTAVLAHPGYGLRGNHTPNYLATLARYKVAICTASKYGYALRKIIEATACGCRVLTDLPADDVLPEIDGNLCRISIDNSTREIADILRMELDKYDGERQRFFAQRAIAYYDYRRLGQKLREDIEQRLRLWRTAKNDPSATGMVHPN